jgi:hypothetical protein
LLGRDTNHNGAGDECHEENGTKYFFTIHGGDPYLI